MKKRDPKKQAKLQKITTKRARYEKARKQNRIAGRPKPPKSMPEPPSAGGLVV